MTQYLEISEWNDKRMYARVPYNQRPKLVSVLGDAIEYIPLSEDEANCSMNVLIMAYVSKSLTHYKKQA